MPVLGAGGNVDYGARFQANGGCQPNEYARGHVHVFGPYLYRSEFWASTPEGEGARALHQLERVIQLEGPQTIAALLLKTIPGTASILTPPPGYLPGVRELRDRYGIVLILDEVMAGFGRTREWFAFDGFDVMPDLITFAKGVNSGYIPVGGVVISDGIARHFDDRVFPGGLTYSGHPLAAASVIATIDVMRDEDIVTNAKRLGEDVIGPRLRDIAASQELVGEVRGSGVFWAIELVDDAASRTPLAAADMGRLKTDLLRRGLLPFIADNRIHVVSPAVISDADAERGIDIVADALTVFASRRSTS